MVRWVFWAVNEAIGADIGQLTGKKSSFLRRKYKSIVMFDNHPCALVL